MIKLELLFGIVTLAMWVFSMVDAIGSDEGRIRHLPKVWWLLIVLFFPFAGSVAWLVAGRPTGGPARRPANEWTTPANPEDDEAFLRRVRERAEEQRRRHRESKKQDPEPET